MNPVEQFGKPTMSPSQIALWVERLNPKPKQRTVPGPAMTPSHRRGAQKPVTEAPEKPATAAEEAECVHHWMLSTPNGPDVTGQCKKCGTERIFDASGDRDLRSDGHSRGGLAGAESRRRLDTSLTVKADRGGRW